MKTCSNCGQPIQENDMKNAAEILGELEESSSDDFDDQNLCQACKEELGMLSLMGFGARNLRAKSLLFNGKQ